MFDVQVVASDGYTLWIRVRSARSSSVAAALACKRAAAENPRHGRFYPGAVLPV
jgi:hypothetical protein